jgi:hypothetical protein
MTQATSKRRGHGEDSIYWDESKARYLGAVSLPGKDGRDGPVPCVAVGKARVSFGQLPRVGWGLQQRGDPLRLIGRDLRSERLEDQVVLPGPWQHVGVGVVPAGWIAPGGQGEQDFLLLVADAVFGQQLAQFLAANAALAVSILLIFERSHSRVGAASSSV